MPFPQLPPNRTSPLEACQLGGISHQRSARALGEASDSVSLNLSSTPRSQFRFLQPKRFVTPACDALSSSPSSARTPPTTQLPLRLLVKWGPPQVGLLRRIPQPRSPSLHWSHGCLSQPYESVTLAPPPFPSTPSFQAISLTAHAVSTSTTQYVLP